MRRIAALAFAAGLAALGAWMVGLYLGPREIAYAVVALGVIVGLVRPVAWLIVLPALYPILSFAPWTGSLLVEECDLLAAAVLSATYLRVALASGPPGAARATLGLAGTLFVAALGSSYLAGAWIGGAFRSSSYAMTLASDYAPFDAPRIWKGWLMASCTLPLLWWQGADLAACRRRLRWGLTIGLTFVLLAGLWERLAFTGLADLASDYRITASFWEMHVGGAALDGTLALALPVALLQLAYARHLATRLLFPVLLLLGGYIVLVTFSRGLYAGIAIAFAMLLFAIMSRPGDGPGASVRRWGVVLVLASLSAGLFMLAFARGGYRSTAAIAGLAMAALVAAPQRDGLRSAGSVVGMPIAAAVAVGLLSTALLSDKGAYVAYALAAAVLAVALAATRRDRRFLPVVNGAYVALAGAALLVAWHWGGRDALLGALPAVAVASAACMANRVRSNPWWEAEAQTVVAGVFVIAVALGVAVTAASYAVGARFATASEDFEGRLLHWQRVVALAPTPNVLGAGLGTLPQAYLFSIRGAEFPGSFSIVRDRDGLVLRLGGPDKPASFGEIVKVGQVVGIDAVPFPVTVRLEVRAAKPARLAVHVCQRHLLYFHLCTGAEPQVVASGDAWTPVQAVLAGVFPASSWFAPRPLVFSVLNEEPHTIVDVRAIEVVDATGRSLLRNGDFGAASQSWFFSSDRLHTPWHAKNLWLAMWFDQGWLGAVSFTLLLALALRRLAAPRFPTRDNLPLAAGFVAFLVVGLFDSLLDVPRLAFLFYLTLFVTLLMPARAGASR